MNTLADIVGAGTVVGLGAAPGTRATWLQFVVSGGGTVRIGDSDTTSTRGLPVDAGGAFMAPYRGNLQWYPLDGIRIYVPVGATVSVIYAP